MMKAKFLPVLGIALAGFLFSAAGSAEAVEVDIRFSKYLTKVMPRINVVERQREEYFRRYRLTRRHTRGLSFARWPAVQWANQVLIPDLNDFSVEALTRGFVTASLERAGVDGVERIAIVLDLLRVEDHPVTIISGLNSVATGTITAYDAAGKVIGTADVTANLITNFIAAPRYNGTDFAFPDTSRRVRVGPTLANFVYKGLGKIFPGREFARTVLITY